MNAKVAQNQNGVETYYEGELELATGLLVPEVKTLKFPTLAEEIPLLTFEQARNICESEDYVFGEQLFDESWAKFQNGYGSCAGWGGATALSKARIMQGQPRQDLSGDYAYSHTNGGSDRGSMLDDNMEALLKWGCATAETVPLGKIYRHLYDQRIADAEAARFRGHELFALPDKQSMVTALALRWPVVVAIHVTSRWRSFDRHNMLAPARGRGNHCEHCDHLAWDAQRGDFKMRKDTSHGVDYGIGGKCWTNWDDHYATPSRYHVFYAVPSAIMDPYWWSQFNEGETPEPSPVPTPVVTMDSRTDCGHCVRWKDQELPKLLQEGWKFNLNSGSGGGVPRFHVQVGTKKSTVIGFKTFDELKRTANAL